MAHLVSMERAGSVSEMHRVPSRNPSIIEENAELAGRLWKAVSEADVDSIIGFLSPDIVWSNFSSGILTGTRCGPDAVLDLFAQLGELADPLNLELLDVFSSCNGAVIHYAMHAERGLDSVDTQVLLNLRIRDGLVINVVGVPVNAEVDNAFWRAL